MTASRTQLSWISRTKNRFVMQNAASAAVADALSKAPKLFGHAKQHRIKTTAKRMATCAATTTIRLVTPPGGPSEIVYRNQRRCRNGLCMPCARIRAREANIRIGKRLDRILADDPTARFAFRDTHKPESSDRRGGRDAR